MTMSANEVGFRGSRCRQLVNTRSNSLAEYTHLRLVRTSTECAAENGVKAAPLSSFASITERTQCPDEREKAGCR